MRFNGCFAMVSGAVLIGCSPRTLQTKTEVVEIPKIETHVEYKRDSLIIHDSIYVVSKEHIWSENDTTYIERNTETTRIHTERQMSADTIIIHDSIGVPVPYPVPEPYEVEVEKKLSWFQKTLMWTGGIAILLIIVFILMKLRNLSLFRLK